MMIVLRLFALLVYIFGSSHHCNGHAIFWEPPSRASLGKHNMNSCKVPINDDHMSLYCGGIQVRFLAVAYSFKFYQYFVSRPSIKSTEGNVGFVETRSEPATNRTLTPESLRQASQAAPISLPVKYEKVSKLPAAAAAVCHNRYSEHYFFKVINVIIDVVANHRGFFVFRLCPNNNPKRAPNAECFARFPLKLASGESFHFLETSEPKVRVQLGVKLPDGLECWQCIIQWTYVAGKNKKGLLDTLKIVHQKGLIYLQHHNISGNNWGIGNQTAEINSPDCVTDTVGKLGCGPQETFRGCADVCIGPR